MDSLLFMLYKTSVIRFRHSLGPPGAMIRALAEQHLANAGEFLDAWFERRAPPPIKTRGGLTIYHAWPTDPVYLLVREIFFEDCYTGSGFYSPDDSHTVLDCGANIGIFALSLCERAPRIRVHCFEPARDTQRRLALNIDANGLRNNISIHPYALWSEECEKGLKNYMCSGRRSFFDALDACKQCADEIVSCVTLKTAVAMCSVGHINFLKIDTEGAEPEIMGATDSETWNTIDHIAIEYHEELRPGAKQHAMDLLKGQGFKDQRISNSPLSSPSFDAIGIIRARRSRSPWWTSLHP